MSDHQPLELQRWCIDAACRDTIARTAACTDQQAHEAFANLFTEEAQLLRPGGQALSGRAAILAAYRARPAERITHHLLVGTVVDVMSSDSATATTRVLLYKSDAQQTTGPEGRPAQGPALVGRFEDRLVPDAQGRWLICERRASFDLWIPAPA